MRPGAACPWWVPIAQGSAKGASGAFASLLYSTSGPEDPNFMNVFAKCYSFAGRPRWVSESDSRKLYNKLLRHRLLL